MFSTVSYQTISGYKFPKCFCKQNIEYAIGYEPKPTDKFIVTYPKSGTTWTQQIINLIANNGQFDKNNVEFMRKSFLEFSGKDINSYPAIKTHLPYDILIKNYDKAEYLLVFRNPKDCCVSYYYHTLKTDPEFSGDFHQYFKHWISGDVPYGDYFRHTLDYWNHRFDRNFQFLIYEQMKENPCDAVQQIASFMGQTFLDRVNTNEKLLQWIINKCSLESMKTDLNSYDFFIRKGVIGDWKQHLSEEESHLIDNRIQLVFDGTGLEMLWNKYLC